MIDALYFSVDRHTDLVLICLLAAVSVAVLAIVCGLLMGIAGHVGLY